MHRRVHRAPASSPLAPPASSRYLLLEDPETGDVLMPLIYLKAIFQANYSRKLAAMKHRQVTGGCCCRRRCRWRWWRWCRRGSRCWAGQPGTGRRMCSTGGAALLPACLAEVCISAAVPLLTRMALPANGSPLPRLLQRPPTAPWPKRAGCCTGSGPSRRPSPSRPLFARNLGRTTRRRCGGAGQGGRAVPSLPPSPSPRVFIPRLPQHACPTRLLQSTGPAPSLSRDAAPHCSASALAQRTYQLSPAAGAPALGAGAHRVQCAGRTRGHACAAAVPSAAQSAAPQLLLAAARVRRRRDPGQGGAAGGCMRDGTACFARSSSCGLPPTAAC